MEREMLGKAPVIRESPYLICDLCEESLAAAPSPRRWLTFGWFFRIVFATNRG